MECKYCGDDFEETGACLAIGIFIGYAINE